MHACMLGYMDGNEWIGVLVCTADARIRIGMATRPQATTTLHTVLSSVHTHTHSHSNIRERARTHIHYNIYIRIEFFFHSEKWEYDKIDNTAAQTILNQVYSPKLCECV